jgi:hypothetical protein
MARCRSASHASSWASSAYQPRDESAPHLLTARAAEWHRAPAEVSIGDLLVSSARSVALVCVDAPALVARRAIVARPLEIEVRPHGQHVRRPRGWIRQAVQSTMVRGEVGP